MPTLMLLAHLVLLALMLELPRQLQSHEDVMAQVSSQKLRDVIFLLLIATFNTHSPFQFPFSCEKNEIEFHHAKH